MADKGNLARYREESGMSQVQLAGQLSVSQQTLSSWERGKTTPKPFQMQRLEEILGVSKEILFYEEFHKQK